ncbi:MAG: response regulator transcription factor, partial [Lactobacillus iners]|nr:response regulator transcription factor [Lactobacillus iners]
MNILLIEKEEAIIQILEAFFMKEKWNYDIATDGVIGTQMYSLNKNKYNLVLVDVELPSLDGVEVVKYIRNISLETPILVLAEKKFEEELISSLQQGADGYLALLMVARIKALYRRINLERGKRVNLNIEQVICTKYLKIYPEKHKVIFNKQEINSLSPKEFAILIILASSPMQVFSRKKLLELVW